MIPFFKLKYVWGAISHQQDQTKFLLLQVFLAILHGNPKDCTKLGTVNFY